MARRLYTNAEIDTYLESILDAAEHHAPKVAGIISPLADIVRAKLDLNKDKVEVYERNGKLARTCWITLQGKKYVFTYNYSTHQIELRRQSLQGATLYLFDNNTSMTAIADVIRDL